jgi:hypothetical protein
MVAIGQDVFNVAQGRINESAVFVPSTTLHLQGFQDRTDGLEIARGKHLERE